LSKITEQNIVESFVRMWYVRDRVVANDDSITSALCNDMTMLGIDNFLCIFYVFVKQGIEIVRVKS